MDTEIIFIKIFQELKYCQHYSYIKNKSASVVMKVDN